MTANERVIAARRLFNAHQDRDNLIRERNWWMAAAAKIGMIAAVGWFALVWLLIVGAWK